MFSMVNLVVDPLGLGFFVNGLLAAVLAFTACAMFGLPVLLRQEAYFAQGVGQSMVAGSALAAWVGFASVPMAFVSAVCAALLVGLVSRRAFVSASSATAIVSCAMLAFGVALISADRERSVNVSNVLFGNVLGVSSGDLVLLAVCAVVSALFVGFFGRRMFLGASSAMVASVHGERGRLLEQSRLVLLALVVAASAQVVGVSLVVSALVFPVLIVAPYVRSLRAMLLLPPLVGATIGTLGMYVSYYVDLPSGPAMVLTATLMFAVARSAA